MILIKRQGENPYNIYNIKERSRSGSWSLTIEDAIRIRFIRVYDDYIDISLDEALTKGGNEILWHIPISETTTEDEIKLQYPEFFI